MVHLSASKHRGEEKMTLQVYKMPELYRDQKVVFDDPAHIRMVYAGRRWGKTRLGVYQGIDWTLGLENVAYITPNFRMSPHKLICDLLHESGMSFKSEEMMRIRIYGSTLHLLSVYDLRSVHKRFDAVIVDEGAFIGEEAYDHYLSPFLYYHTTSKNLLLLSSPNRWSRPQSWFTRRFKKILKEEVQGSAYSYPTDNFPEIDLGLIEHARQSLSDVAFRRDFLAVSRGFKV